MLRGTSKRCKKIFVTDNENTKKRKVRENLPFKVELTQSQNSTWQWEKKIFYILRRIEVLYNDRKKKRKVSTSNSNRNSRPHRVFRRSNWTDRRVTPPRWLISLFRTLFMLLNSFFLRSVYNLKEIGHSIAICGMIESLAIGKKWEFFVEKLY